MTPKRIPLRQLHNHWPIYGFAIPAIVLIGLFQYYPAASGIYHSFFRWNGADIQEFTGLENYRQLLADNDFWQSFRVALLLGVWNVIKMIPALAVAICIHRCRSERMQWIYRAMFVAPMVIPGLVVVLIWRSFFFEATTGYLNHFLYSTHLLNLLARVDQAFGLGGIFQIGHKPAWLGDGRLLLVACIIWGFPWVGSFAVLTHLAKLQNIPKDLYEAGDLDGTTWWSCFTRIELPLMMGSINILLVFVIIDTIKDAGMILALAGMEGGPGGVVTVPALFMLRKAFINQELGSACAVGIVLTIIVMTLKKLLDAVGRWEDLATGQRLLLRLLGIAIAGALYRFLDSPLLAIAVGLAVVPWGIIVGFFSDRFPRRQRRTRGGDSNHAMSGYLLRLAKHGWIWLVLAFAYLPLYLMLIVSVKNNTQFYDSPTKLTLPLHLNNWTYAWDQVVPALANSVFVTTLSTALTVLVALAAAYFFARVRVPGSAFLWNALLVLMMMPTIANLVPLFRLLTDMNLINTLTALILVGAAGGQAFAIFVLRQFVADIPQELFEAAEVDGANHFRQMFMVVLPLSAPILGVVAIMFAVSQWNDFILPLIIIRDAARLPVMVQLLRMAGEYIKLWGPLMAGYSLASLPVIVLFIASMRLFTRGLTDGAVKG
jgi:ABC-type glycerol-3-phosphate transport system permease component